MSHRYPRLRIQKELNGKRWRCTREGVSFCFYMQREHAQVAQGVWHALEVFRRAVGGQPLDSYADYEGYWQALDDESWELNRHAMLESPAATLKLKGVKGDNFAYGFIYHGTSYEWAPSSAEQQEVCTAVFYLPTEYLEAHGPGKVRELAMELARRLPFDSGHAGLCLHYMTGTGIGVNEEVGRLSFLHPGMDLLPDLYRFHPLGARLDGVHWLNFLGQPVLSGLGGVEALRARLHSPGTMLQPMEDERALVSLGPWPEAGDLEQGHVLPHYQELARLLEPWLYMGRQHYTCFSNQEEMLRWERRFL